MNLVFGYIFMKKILFISGIFLFLSSCTNAVTETEYVTQHMSSENHQYTEKYDLIATPSFYIRDVLPSPDKKFVVFSEISTHIFRDEERTEEFAPKFEYIVRVKDLQSQRIREILYYKEEKNRTTVFMPRALAGGCPQILVPETWTKNSKKIILKPETPTNCGSGGRIAPVMLRNPFLTKESLPHKYYLFNQGK